MPVAISGANSVASVAQFLDGTVSGDANRSSMSKDCALFSDNDQPSPSQGSRKSSIDDFDAVLAMLVNGVGIPLPTPLVVSPNGTNSATPSTENITDSAGQNTSTLPGVIDTGGGKTNEDAAAGRSIVSNAVAQMRWMSQSDASSASSVIQGSDAKSALPGEIVSGPVSDAMSTVNNSASVSTASMDGAWQNSVAQTGFQNAAVSSVLTADVATPNVAVDGQTIAEEQFHVHQADPATITIPLSRQLIEALERVGVLNEGRPDPIRLPGQKTAGPVSDVLLQQKSDASIGVQVATLPTASVRSETVVASTNGALGGDGSQATLADAFLQLSGRSSSPTALFADSPKVMTDPQLAVHSLSSEAAVSSDFLEVHQGPSGTGTLIVGSDSIGAGFETTLLSGYESGSPSGGHQKSDGGLSDSDRGEPQVRAISDSNSTTGADVAQNNVSLPSGTHLQTDLATSISSDLREPLTNQVSQAILDHIERSGARQNDSLSVRLDPPELGEMTIQLSKTHEGLTVRVTASEAVTMDMLLARGQEIESQLRNQQLNLKSLEFQRTDMSNSGFSQGQQQQQSESSRRSESLRNQNRSSLRRVGQTSLESPKVTVSDSPYGLNFRA